MVGAGIGLMTACVLADSAIRWSASTRIRASTAHNVSTDRRAGNRASSSHRDPDGFAYRQASDRRWTGRSGVHRVAAEAARRRNADLTFVRESREIARRSDDYTLVGPIALPAGNGTRSRTSYGERPDAESPSSEPQFLRRAPRRRIQAPPPLASGPRDRARQLMEGLPAAFLTSSRRFTDRRTSELIK